MKRQVLLLEFLRYAWFNVLGMLGISCYILADTFFVSKGMGADGLAALNLAIPVYNLINGTGLMLGMGGAIRYAVHKAQGNDGGKFFTNSLYAGIAFAVVYFTAGCFFPEQIAQLLGGKGEVLVMTRTYLQVLLLFSPAFLLNSILLSFVRNDSDPGLSMAAMIFGSLMNILLDYLFIFPLSMGIFGAVFATGLAPLFSMLVLSIHWRKKENGLKVSRCIPNKSIISILFLGIPSLITELSSGIVIVVYNLILLSLEGNVGVAAYGVIANLSLVAMAVFTGIGQGMQPLISRSWGQNDRHSARYLLRCGMGSALIVATFIYVILFVYTQTVVGIFNSEGNLLLQDIAQTGLRLYFIGMPFAGINIVFCSFFAASQQPIPAQIISLLRGLFLIIPLAFLMSYWMGTNGIWLSFLLTECLVTLFGIAVYWKIKRREITCDKK